MPKPFGYVKYNNANQIGILKRVIVVDTGDFRQAFVNPTIERRYGGLHTQREGCLSYPDKTVPMVRAKQIIVTGWDEHWRPLRFKLKGFNARVVQHEVDHLDGRTIMDAVQ